MDGSKEREREELIGSINIMVGIKGRKEGRKEERQTYGPSVHVKT